MEYFLGSLLTLIAFYVFKLLNKSKENKSIRPIITQSYIHNLIAPAIPIMELLQKYNKPETQSSLYEKSFLTTVLVLDDHAYWIKDNSVYSANMHGNKIDNESVQILDIINMDDIQLEKMKFIIDKLTKGTDDDSGDSGYKKF